MADEFDETEPAAPVDVAKAPNPALTVDHGRALGFSRRGVQVPKGSDVLAPDVPVPSVDDQEPATFGGSPYADPAAPLTADQSERHTKARAELDAQAKEKWNDDYVHSRPVPANGPVIDPKAYKKAEVDADRAAAEESAQITAERRTKNARAEAQMRSTGQRYYVDGAGQVQPLIEPKTNRPLFHASQWEEGAHPQTGETSLVKTDQYGQRQYKRPPIVASPDTTDNQLYYKLPDGSLKEAGDMDALMKHSDFNVQRAAMRAVHTRNAAMWKEAITPMEEVASGAVSAHDAAQQQSLDYQAQIDDVNAKLGEIDPNTLNAKSGGILGIGASQTPESISENNKQNALLAQLDQLNKSKGEIDAQTKPGGSLWQTKRKATLDLAIFKAKASHDNYLDAATERRLILKAQGKPEADDPILNSILQAQKTYGDAITKFAGVAQKEQQDYASKHRLVGPLGKPLPVGAPVPGKPGVYESPEGSASKYTLSNRQPAPAGAPVAPSQAVQSTNNPALSVANAVPQAAVGAPKKIDQALASEPFALAAKGVKNVGSVSMQEIAKRYGSGEGAVQPTSLIKMKQRSDDITATLENPKTQLDGKVREGLQKEQEYLNSLTTQRFARLTPEQQKRVTDATRDPTFWEKIKSGTVVSGARGAGGVITDIGESVARNVSKLAAASSSLTTGNPTGAAQAIMGQEPGSETIPEMAGAMREQAESWRASDAPEVEKKLREGALTGVLPEAVGGMAPYVAGGEVVGAAGKALGLGEAAVTALVRASTVAAGSAQGGNSLRREAINTLKPQLESGQITQEQYNKAVGLAELAGSAIGGAAMEIAPITRFAQRLGGMPMGKSFMNTLLDKAAKGGSSQAMKWLSGEAGSKALANVVREGTQQAGAGFVQTLMTDLAAQQTFDPNREVSPAKAGEEAGKMGVVGMIASALTHLRTAGKSGGPSEPTAEPSPIAPVEPEAPAAPFKPTGEGAPKSASESAKTLVPEAEKIKSEQVPPAKSAEESALAFKAHDELDRRSAEKEKAAQSLVDDIQKTTGKSREEILSTRTDKDIDAWTKELKDEAKYQKNPLVADPERRAKELREELKKIDAEWQDHVTKTGQEAEAAAEIQKVKDSQPQKTAEEAAQETERQKKLGVELPEAKTQARHDDLMARREAIEEQLTAADRLRKSPEGGEKLKQDLSAQEKGGSESQADIPESEAKASAEESPLGDQPVKLKVRRSKTGEMVEVEMSAKKAEKRVNDHINTLAKVIDCLGGAA